jgi:hypothetical protein
VRRRRKLELRALIDVLGGGEQQPIHPRGFAKPPPFLFPAIILPSFVERS